MSRVKMVLSRVSRFSAALAVGVLAMLGLSNPHAHAASSISASSYMTTTHDGAPSNVWHHLWIVVRLPMNQWDAQGYLNNGAQVKIDCYGDDTFSDDRLFPTTSVYTASTGGDVWLPGTDGPIIHGVNRLQADSNGVAITAIISGKHGHMLGDYAGGGFNEDFGADEVYCKTTWIDGDGARLSTFSPVVVGNF